MDSADTKKLRALSELLRACWEIRPTATLRQLDALVEIILSDGITRADLARKINMTEGSVTRLVQDLGPEGTQCLAIEGDKVTLDPQCLPKWRRYLDS